MPNNPLEEALYQTLCRHQVIDTRFFVACSGGRDSLSLAFACVQLYKLGKISQLPTLIHIHHGLQACADDWANGVESFAHFYNLPIIIKYLQLKDNSEQGARVGRYQAFFDCANDGDFLLMAHHQDDQAETVLMRLINGTGLDGLTAMAEFSQKFQNNQTLNIIRPWLAISRVAISEYANLHQLPYVDDPTNLAGDGHINARAFIRTHLKDLLHHLNPKAYANIARTAQVLAGDNQLVQDCVQPLFKQRLTVVLPYFIGFEVADFDSLSPSLQIALVRAFAKYALPDSPNHRLSTDLLGLATYAHSNHQTMLFWQTSLRAYVFYRYKSIIYRYDNAFWQALQGDIALDIDGQRGQFSWQGGAMVVDFEKPVIFCQRLNRTDKLWLGHHCYAGKKLYQRLGISLPHRQNLWHIKTTIGEFVLAVGQAWLIAGRGSVRFLKDNLVI